MPTPPLSDEDARAALAAYKQHGNMRAAALALDIPEERLRGRVKTARARGLDRPPGNPEREAFLRANVRGFSGGIELPQEAIDDLAYFAEQAKLGRAIRLAALLDWMRSKHGLQVGPTRLHRIATEAGLTPWWSAR